MLFRSKKKDPSGTGLKWKTYFEELGVSMDEMKSVRDADTQKEIGVPDEFISGHGYHWIDAMSEDGNVKLEFSTKVNGRDTYAYGTVHKAIPFLMEKIGEGSKGQVFSMIDVLKG